MTPQQEQTKTGEPQKESTEPEAALVPFPQLSGANWPSYLLQVWLALHRIGVPEKNIRFLPEIGHFALPEVVEEEPEEDWERHSAHMGLRHPRGAHYERDVERATVYDVNPKSVRPRLKVNVRADYRLRDESEAEKTGDFTPTLVGRLAHFMEPLLAGLPPLPNDNTPAPEPPSPGASRAEPGPSESDPPRERAEKPLARLTRQICARYPELMAVVPTATRNLLTQWADHLQRALETPDPETRRRWLDQAAQVIPPKTDTLALADVFETQAGKLMLSPEQWSVQAAIGARARLREWSAAMTQDTPHERAAHLIMLADALTDVEIAQQRALLQMLGDRLAQETSRERYRIVRELMEILTTEVFTGVAVLDCLWGIGWIHGRAEDLRLPAGKSSAEGVFLSFTGGMSQRTLMLLLIERWLRAEGFLGVVSRPPPSRRAGSAQPLSSEPLLALDSSVAPAARSIPTPGEAGSAPDALLADICDTDLLSAEERQELWSLVAWRREAPDPLLLLQTAAQRLIAPDVEVEWNHYQNVGGGFGTLFSQPGATAALGGMVQVHYPGVTIYMPFTEDGDDAALAAKARD